MANEVFVLATGLFYLILLPWGFKALPGERWQILASVPVRKAGGENWKGLNITFYGFFIACAYTIATAVMFVLLGAVGVPAVGIAAVSLAMAVPCVPASRWVAMLVEKKSHTSTVGGAACVGAVLAPWSVWFVNTFFGPSMGFDIDVMHALAAFSVAYSFGEGTGRLGCISFGCCYGRPVADCRPFIRRLFGRLNFVFRGKTKKIAYADGLDGEEVVPIQAVTSTIFVATALVGLALYLHGRPGAAFLETTIITQVWRVVSEFFRADHRGFGRFSAYQWMALLSVGYALAMVVLFAGPSGGVLPRVERGLSSLWDPGALLFLQLTWFFMFFMTGRSAVTGSVITFHVVKDKI